jgi:uncharacterized membrane protein YkoI
MAYTEEGIEALGKRLKRVEDAIDELGKGDLLIARVLANELCRARYETFLAFQKGEQLKSYEDFWGKKLDEAREGFATSQGVEDVFKVVIKFRIELIEYMMAEKVKTATEAMDIAHSFIKKYVPVALPIRTVREDDVWLVDIDVGALAVKIAKVKVDARTGDILSYEIPEK